MKTRIPKKFIFTVDGKGLEFERAYVQRGMICIFTENSPYFTDESPEYSYIFWGLSVNSDKRSNGDCRYAFSLSLLEKLKEEGKIIVLEYLKE